MLKQLEETGKNKTYKHCENGNKMSESKSIRSFCFV